MLSEEVETGKQNANLSEEPASELAPRYGVEQVSLQRAQVGTG
jgi:hypothetical protein